VKALNMAVVFKQLAAAARAFGSDTRGVILPYVTVMLVVIVGIAVLALDGARGMSLQTQLQNAADAFALAGAAELDGTSSAITRATNAINNTVTNTTLPGMGNQTVQLASAPLFLSSLPADTVDPIPGANYTTDPAKARFVEVKVQPTSLQNILPASFFGGSNTLIAAAQAVAGRGDEVICGIPPLFMCNPYETAGMTDEQATDALRTSIANPVEHRRQWKLGTNKSGPGQFGWLVPPDGNMGASNLSNWIAQTRPSACYKKSSVDLNTGQKTSVYDGFNVRFDLYKGSLNYDPAHAPGVNVRKGYIPGGGPISGAEQIT